MILESTKSSITKYLMAPKFQELKTFPHIVQVLFVFQALMAKSPCFYVKKDAIDGINGGCATIQCCSLRHTWILLCFIHLLICHQKAMLLLHSHWMVRCDLGWARRQCNPDENHWVITLKIALNYWIHFQRGYITNSVRNGLYSHRRKWIEKM